MNFNIEKFNTSCSNACRVGNLDKLIELRKQSLEGFLNAKELIATLLIHKPENYSLLLKYLLEKEEVKKGFSSHVFISDNFNVMNGQDIIAILKSTIGKPEKTGHFIKTVLDNLINKRKVNNI